MIGEAPAEGAEREPGKRTRDDRARVAGADSGLRLRGPRRRRGVPPAQQGRRPRTARRVRRVGPRASCLSGPQSRRPGRGADGAAHADHRGGGRHPRPRRGRRARRAALRPRGECRRRRVPADPPAHAARPDRRADRRHTGAAGEVAAPARRPAYSAARVDRAPDQRDARRALPAGGGRPAAGPAGRRRRVDVRPAQHAEQRRHGAGRPVDDPRAGRPHARLRAVPRVRPRGGLPLRRRAAGRDRRRRVPGLAGLLHGRDRLLPAEPLGAAAYRPGRDLLQRALRAAPGRDVRPHPDRSAGDGRAPRPHGRAAAARAVPSAGRLLHRQRSRRCA